MKVFPNLIKAKNFICLIKDKKYLTIKLIFMRFFFFLSLPLYTAVIPLCKANPATLYENYIGDSLGFL